MEHGILNGLRIKVVGDIGRKGRKSREPVDEVDLALGSRALSAYMRQQVSKHKSPLKPYKMVTKNANFFLKFSTAVEFFMSFFKK